MTVATVEFMSEALWRRVTYTALLPDLQEADTGPYPVLYQLHGGNQNHTSWLHFSRLLQYIRHLPLIVILPDGAQTRWANGGTPFTRYEDFLMEDLANHVKQTFHASSGKWAIGGNSMGGFGAVRLGLKYPHRFCSIWSHSGGFPKANNLPEHWYWSGNADDLDCYALVDQIDVETMPCLSFDCGTDDHLFESNQHFHAFLKERGIPHTYKVHPGTHNWEYWDAHLQEAIKQHMDEFACLPTA